MDDGTLPPLLDCTLVFTPFGESRLDQLLFIAERLDLLFETGDLLAAFLLLAVEVLLNLQNAGGEDGLVGIQCLVARERVCE